MRASRITAVAVAALVLAALALGLVLGRWGSRRAPVYDTRPAGPGRACMYEDDRLVECFPFTFPPGSEGLRQQQGAK